MAFTDPVPSVVADALRCSSRYFVIVGPGGCGKTSLVKKLLGGQSSVKTYGGRGQYDLDYDESEAMDDMVYDTVIKRHYVIDDTVQTNSDPDGDCDRMLNKAMTERNIIVWHVVRSMDRVYPSRVPDACFVFPQTEEAHGVYTKMRLDQTFLSAEAFAATLRGVDEPYAALVVTPEDPHLTIVHG